MNAILPHLPRAVRAMVEIQALTGMRPTEVALMRTADLNTTGTIWEYRPSSHKLEDLDVERIIMIGPRAQAVLKPWLKTDLAAFLFSPAETMAEFQCPQRAAANAAVVDPPGESGHRPEASATETAPGSLRCNELPAGDPSGVRCCRH